jgi:hypothetical protein
LDDDLIAADGESDPAEQLDAHAAVLRLRGHRRSLLAPDLPRRETAGASHSPLGTERHLGAQTGNKRTQCAGIELRGSIARTR